MANYFVVILFLLSLLGYAGCTRSEGPPQTNQRVTVEPPEHRARANDIQEQARPAPTDLEPDKAAPRPAPSSKDGVPPAETDGSEVAEARRETGPEDLGEIEDAIVAEGHKPAAVAPAEPNDGLPAPAEPNGTTTPESKRSTLPAFYDRYANILKAYVRKDGWVDYGSLRRRRLELKPLLMELDELDPNVYQGWSQNEKLAFWINAYNLKMLEIITRNYPIESSWWLRLTWPPSDIRHIKGIWTDHKFIVMDEEFTLAEVERRFFHKTFQDPRVYLAVTYASRSSPPLRREVYQGENLDEQLDRQVKTFLASDEGLRIDRRNMVVHISALFKSTWRGKEFVSRYGTDKKFKDRDAQTRAALNFITNYLSREDVYFLEVENYTIEYINFDWRLNDSSGGN